MRVAWRVGVLVTEVSSVVVTAAVRVVVRVVAVLVAAKVVEATAVVTEGARKVDVPAAGWAKGKAV